MVRNILLILMICFWGVPMTAAEKLHPSRDSRFAEAGWEIRILEKFRPSDNLGFNYKVFEGSRGLLWVYYRKEIPVRAIFMKGDATLVVDPKDLKTFNKGVKYESGQYCLIDLGEFGNFID